MRLRAAAVHDAVQVDAQHRVPVVARHLGEPLPAGNPGVGHERVEPPQTVDCRCDETLVLRRARHVGAHEDGPTAERLDSLHAARRFLLVPDVVQAMSKPRFASATAMPRPMPRSRAAPVTSATGA